MKLQTKKTLIVASVVALLVASGFGIYQIINTKNDDRLLTGATVTNSEQTQTAASSSEDTNWDNLLNKQVVLDETALTITEPGTYILTGTTGKTVTVNSTGAVRLVLNGVMISSTSGPAIHVQNSSKTVIQLAFNTTNKLQDNLVKDDLDGVIYTKSDLIIEGDGNLDISAKVEHGIVAKNLTVLSGNIIMDTVGKAITITEGLVVEGGDINIVKSEEGLEAARVTIAGGKVKIYATDDGIKASSNNSADVYIKIAGGDITVVVADADADALDSNGDIYMSGGTLDITAKISSFDFDGKASYTGGVIYVNGAKVDQIVNSMLMKPARQR